jgi:hypothetical protein
MTNHPEVQHKLRNHLLERLPALQDRPPTYEDLNATTVPYLEAVVHEALRLSRTAGGYTRQGGSLSLAPLISKQWKTPSSSATGCPKAPSSSHRRRPGWKTAPLRFLARRLGAPSAESTLAMRCRAMTLPCGAPSAWNRSGRTTRLAKWVTGLLGRARGSCRRDGSMRSGSTRMPGRACLSRSGRELALARILR